MSSLLTKEHEIDPVANWRAGHIERARGGDGYDVMEKVETSEAWRSVASWGRDGWDLGDWPYVVIYVRRTEDGYDLATYCEGDVTIYRYATVEERNLATDELAFFYWHNHDEDWVKGIEIHEDMTPNLRGPFSWKRLDAEKAA